MAHVTARLGAAPYTVQISTGRHALIADEPPVKPLSDAQLAEILSKEGVKVARRTVAKYRESLGLASSSERRHAAGGRSGGGRELGSM